MINTISIIGSGGIGGGVAKLAAAAGFNVVVSNKSGQSILPRTGTGESPLLVVMQKRALVLQSMGPHHDVWSPWSML